LFIFICFTEIYLKTEKTSVFQSLFTLALTREERTSFCDFNGDEEDEDEIEGKREADNGEDENEAGNGEGRCDEEED
jgi:hypothetical protein